jgi:hypothetical protein
MDVLVEGGKEVLLLPAEGDFVYYQSTVQDAFILSHCRRTRKRQKLGNGLQKSEIIYRTIF